MKIKLEVVQRDNDLLQQEVQLLKRMTQNSQPKTEQDNLISWVSDELKILDLTAHLKDLTKQNHKLSNENENLESTLLLRSRNLEDLNKENQNLKASIAGLQVQLDETRVVLAKYESQDKIRQLENDEQVEVLKRFLISSANETFELKNLLTQQEDDISQERSKSDFFRLLLEKMAEREDTSDSLILELKNQQLLSFTELSQVIQQSRSFIQSMTNFENMVSQRFDGFSRRIQVCHETMNDIHAATSLNSNSRMIEVALPSSEFRAEQFPEAKDKASSVRSNSESGFERVSAEYAKNYAQNSKVFAFMENECTRLKALCDHLRGMNNKVNIELKRAMLSENRCKSLEQKVRLLTQSEQSLVGKCARLESMLKKKNEELLSYLRNQDERENSKLCSLQAEVDGLKQQLEELESSRKYLVESNNKLKLRGEEIQLLLENERKLWSHQIQNSQNETMVSRRLLSDKDLEMSALKNKVEELNTLLHEKDLKLSLTSEEFKSQESALNQKIKELTVEIEDKSRKLEVSMGEVSRTKSKLLEIDSKLLAVNEDYSKLLISQSQKDEKNLSLSKDLEDRQRQLDSAAENFRRLQEEYKAKIVELQEVERQFNFINDSFQSEQKLKLELENSMR